MTIQSIQRAIAVLSLFSHAHPRWGISEMAQALGLAKATVQNIVNTLTQGGFLKQDAETRRYALGPRIFTLGVIMAGTLDVNQKGAGPVHRLAGETNLTCRLAIWDTDAALITLDVTPDYASGLSSQIGPRVVAYCSAIGRALLAWLEPDQLNAYMERIELVAYTAKTVTDPDRLRAILDKARHLGYAVNDQELAPGQSSVAAPIFGSGGRLSASISLTGSAHRVMGTGKGDIVMSLRKTAAEISKYMGHFPATPDAVFKPVLHH